MIALLSIALLLQPALPDEASTTVAVEAFAREHVLQRLHADGHADAEVRVTSRQDARALPAHASLAARPIQGRWPRASIGLPIDLLDAQGRPVGSHTVWLALDIPTHGHAFARSLRGGDTVTAEDLRPTRLNLAELGGPPAVPADLLGQRLRRPVRAGMPALAAHVEPPQDVLRDARVLLIVDHGDVQLRTPARTLQPGRIGEVIAIRVDSATEAVRARIESPSNVRLVH